MAIAAKSGEKWSKVGRTGDIGDREVRSVQESAAHAGGPTGVFLGTFTPRLDDKGRLILPAKFRGGLASGLVATRGLDRCIFVFPLDTFADVHNRLKSAPLENKQARDYMRNFLGHASDEIPDKQGRILLTSPLRKYAGINRDVAVVGMGSRVEIWDAPTWEQYLDDGEDDYATTAAEVFGTM